MGLIRVLNCNCVMIVSGIDLMVFISDARVTRGRHGIWACMDGIHYLSEVPTSLLNFLSIFSAFHFQIQSDDCYEIVILFNTHRHIYFYLSLLVLIMSHMQAQTAQEESIRMTAIRKAYQKAIITPTHHVEQLWREYENFENSVSRQLVMFKLWLSFVI